MSLDVRDPLDLLDHQDLPDLLDLVVSLVHLAGMDHQDLVENEERMVHLEQQDKGIKNIL